MSKLKVFVCENFAPDYYRAMEMEALESLEIILYPSVCNDKANASKLQAVIADNTSVGDRHVFICGQHCDVCTLLKDKQNIQLRTFPHCYPYLDNTVLVDYIIRKGGYIIGSGWLADWKAILKRSGFDQSAARQFYGEMCKELLYFDNRALPHADILMAELSAYLNLPRVIIPNDPETIRLLLVNEWLRWRLQETQEEYSVSLADYQLQCAEHSAVLDFINKVASTTNRREMFERVKNIYVMVFGAKYFKFWSADSLEKPEEIRNLLSSTSKPYILLRDQNRICIVVKTAKKVLGVIDVGDFQFPQHLDKYLDFAIEVSKVSSLVLANIEQFEQLQSTENDLQYLSFHDALTGLYNRTYINDFQKKTANTENLAVFMFDIDGLKQVNDQYGHLEGDNLIKSAASLLSRFFRETDILARIGGDEFIACVPNFSDRLAKQCKERIIDAMNAYNAILPKTAVSLSISIGYAISSVPETDLESLIKEADDLMYADKQRKHMH